MRIPNSRKPRTGHRWGGGSSHVRYDHTQRPTLLDIVCPHCQGYAIAKQPKYNEGCLVVGDPHDTDFAVVCSNCMYRANGLGYKDLTEPFHQIVVSGRTLWAWNLKHLHMVSRVLEGKCVQGDPYAFFATYIHRDWFQRRDKFVRTIERHLKAHDL